MGNQQKMPTEDEIKNLHIPHKIQIKTIRFARSDYYFWFLYIGVLGFGAFDLIFEELTTLSLLYFSVPYLVVYFIIMSFGIGVMWKLEKSIEAIKQIKEGYLFGRSLIKNPLNLLQLIFLFLVPFSPLIFLRYLALDFSSALNYTYLMFFIYGIVAYFVFQRSQFVDSFDNLKEGLEGIRKSIEDEEFMLKMNKIEENLLKGINKFNKMLEVDEINLDLDFVRNYIRMLKWFGKQEEWEHFSSILYNAMKGYETFTLIETSSHFDKLKTKFEELKKKTSLARIKSTRSQELVAFLKERSKTFTLGTLVTVIITILTLMGYL